MSQWSKSEATFSKATTKNMNQNSAVFCHQRGRYRLRCCNSVEEVVVPSGNKPQRGKTTLAVVDIHRRKMDRALLQELLSSLGISGILYHMWRCRSVVWRWKQNYSSPTMERSSSSLVSWLHQTSVAFPDGFVYTENNFLWIVGQLGFTCWNSET